MGSIWHKHVGLRCRHCPAGSGWCTLEPFRVAGPCILALGNNGSILTVESYILAAVCKQICKAEVLHRQSEAMQLTSSSNVLATALQALCSAWQFS